MTKEDIESKKLLPRFYLINNILTNSLYSILDLLEIHPDITYFEDDSDLIRFYLYISKCIDHIPDNIQNISQKILNELHLWCHLATHFIANKEHCVLQLELRSHLNNILALLVMISIELDLSNEIARDYYENNYQTIVSDKSPIYIKLSDNNAIYDFI